jgi:hypothetical protein
VVSFDPRVVFACRAQPGRPSLSFVRIPSRRSLAPLIRIRQEVDKRLDPLLPGRSGSEALAGVLGPALTLRIRQSAGGDGLRAALAAATDARFPRAHLLRRDPAALPNRDELLREVADVARGEWSVFHRPLRVDVSRHDWTRHPVTNVKPTDEHWSRVPYVAGIGGGDVKMIWELSRHGQLVRLAQGYFLTRDPARAEAMLALLDQWLDQNPPGRGINWVSALEVAFRAIAWCWIWSLTCDSRAWTAARMDRFLVSLWHHARHVERYDSIHHSPNTHLTGEGLGLMYVGLMFPELRGAGRWARRGEEILDTELDAQVLADGMHFERATGYHRYTAEFYLHFLLLADAFGRAVGADRRDRVRSMVAVTAMLRRPDGSWPVIGDEDGGDTLLLGTTDPQDQGPVLAVGGAYFAARDWLEASTHAHRATGWWLLDDPRWDDARRAPVRLDATARIGALPAAGYYVGREAGTANDWWCLVDAGPHGGDSTGHAHTDLGHVEIARGDSLIVTDPGCATYTTDLAARDWARSEAAHACVVVDDAPLAEPRGPFSWRRIAPTPHASTGDDGTLWWCDLSYERPHAAGRLTHRRQVVLVRGWGLVVCDWVTGDAPAAFALHWPLGAPPESLTLDGAALHIDSGRGTRITWMATAADGALRPSLVPMKRSPGYGRQLEGRLLRVEHAGRLPVTVVTTFCDPSAVFRARSNVASTLELELGRHGGEVSTAVRLTFGEAPTVVRVGASELTPGVRT